MTYEEKLARMIQQETISKVDQTDLTKFLKMHDLLKELFPNIFAKCEYENIDGSMLLKWPGKDKSKKPTLFMNHMDVVEASGEWKYPPFSGEIAEGKLWGRGTQDTKGGLFIMLQAAEELASEGFIPEHDIYFESACNEEVSGGGARKIAALLKERGVDLEFVYDEGGKIMKEEGGLVAQIGVAEKAVVELEFVASSKGGHASKPPKNSPLVKLGRFMAAVDDAEDLFPEKYVEETGEMEKTTIAFTMAKGSDARNVLPTRASVICSMRCSHHQGTKSSIENVTKLAEKYGVEVNVLFDGLESPISATSGPVFDKIVKSIKDVYPEAKIEPFLMLGATDSNYFTSICKDVYRFTPMICTREQEDSVHSINENVDLSALAPAVQSYKILMKL